MKKLRMGIIAMVGLVGLCSYGLGKDSDQNKLAKQKYPKLKLPEAWKYVPQKEEGLGDFFIMEKEVSNFDYQEFLYWVKTNDSANADRYLPAKVAWLEMDEKNRSIYDSIVFYNQFKDYPVVGIDMERAQAYCVFLTNAINKVLQNSESTYKVEASLPSTTEWQYAAFGGLDPQKTIFPWGGSYLENAQGKDLANYKKIQQLAIDDSQGELVVKDVANYDSFGLRQGCIFGPTKAYFPNGYGLYNMSGNVAELTQDQNIMGGDWKSIAKYLKITETRPYQGASNALGFRPILRIVKK